MFGPRNRPSRRSKSVVLSRPLGRRTSLNRLKHTVLAGSLSFAAMTVTIGDQDIIALIAEQKTQTPRWMMALEPAHFSTTVPFTLSLSGNGRADPNSGRHHSLVSAADKYDVTSVTGLQELTRDTIPTEIPVEIEVNRAAKGNRLITRAPDRQMVDMSAGAVYTMPSLIGRDEKRRMPRVAFVKPEPLTKKQSSMLAGIPARTPGSTEGPMDLQEVMMARNAAAASFSLVSAYAPQAAQDTKEPFNALFGAAKYEQETPPPEDPKNPHWWAQKPLPLSVGQAKEQRCMADAIYFEARGESEKGQVAVAQVVLNRVKNPSYPNTICGVVYQNKHKRNRCQFSFACDGIKDRINQPKSWKTAQRLAKEVTGGQQYLKMVDASTHYHATYVNPRWAKSMNKLGQVGLHIFYKTRAGGWN